MSKILRGVGIFLLIYFVFAFLFAVVPYCIHRSPSEDAKKRLDQEEFLSGKLPGPDRVLLIESPTDAFGVRLQMIRKAKHTVDIVYHTLHRGDTADVFLNEVMLAANRGVKVRLLLDGKIGKVSKDIRRKLRLIKEHSNIRVFHYNQLHLLKPWKWQALLHDKFILADNAYLLLGGRNIGDLYFNPKGFEGDVKNDRDIFVWNTGADGRVKSVVPKLSAYMDQLLNQPDTKELVTGTSSDSETEKLSGQLKEKAREFESQNAKFYKKRMQDYLNSTQVSAKITLCNNPTDAYKKEPWVAYQLKRAALAARESVIVQTPYATANWHLLDTMKRLDGENISVKMQINSLGSTPNMFAFSNYLGQREKFLRTGIEIYEYQSKNSIHAKSVCIDDRLSAVGSCNLDDRSFYIDTETMLFVDSETFSKTLKKAIGVYQSQSLKVNDQNEYVAAPGVEEVVVPRIKIVASEIVSIFSIAFQFLI